MTTAADYRPRMSPELTAELKLAAGLAGLTVPEYLDQVVRPYVATDAQQRIERKHLQRVTGQDND